MAKPRCVLPGRTYLVTRRCFDRQFLLRPSATVDSLLRYTLAVAAERFGIEVHAFVFLSNHHHLVVTGAWWDLVDPLASHQVGRILGLDRASVSPAVRAWAREDDLWVRRTAVLCQLGSKADTDTDLLGDVLVANLQGSPYGREFFIRKAVGWALREYAKTDPAWVREFVAAHDADLSGLSKREALKHLDAV